MSAGAKEREIFLNGQHVNLYKQVSIKLMAQRGIRLLVKNNPTFSYYIHIPN
jgi:hypothetical protein